MMKPTKGIKTGALGHNVVKAEMGRPTPAPVPIQVIRAVPTPPATSRVCFELVQPDAKNVYVAGSFNDWVPEKTPLNTTGDGRWTAELRLGRGRHEYLFVVDGCWLPDPNAKESVANPYGGWNSVLFAA